MIARLAILAALWSPLVAACCTPRVVREPVIVRPPPCLDVAPPVPPTTDDDGLWSRYHVAVEGWIAYAVQACGTVTTSDVSIRGEVVDGAAGLYGEPRGVRSSCESRRGRSAPSRGSSGRRS